jgi:hypothetical protein
VRTLLFFSLTSPHYLPMTLITFLAYLFKFLSNPALLSALLAAIQKILR